MDIRKYFSEPAAAGGGSTSLLRGTKTPENMPEVDGKRKSPKTSDVNTRKRQSRVLSSDSDPEDPIPSSISKKSGPLPKKSEKKSLLNNQARKANVVDSDSEKETNREKSFTGIRKSPRSKVNGSKNVEAKNSNVQIVEFSSSDDEDFKTTTTAATKKKLPPKKSKNVNSRQELMHPVAPVQKKSKVSEIDVSNDRNDSELKIPARKKGKTTTNLLNTRENPPEILLPPLPNKSPAKTKQPVPKLNPITVSDYFGGTKISRTTGDKGNISKKTVVVEHEDHNDDRFTNVLKNAPLDFMTPSSSVATPALSMVSMEVSTRRDSPRKRSQIAVTPTKTITPTRSNSSTKNSNIAVVASTKTPSPAKISKRQLNGSNSSKKTPPTRKSTVKESNVEELVNKKRKTSDGELVTSKVAKSEAKSVVRSAASSSVSTPSDDNCLSFADKYKPKTIAQIIGQQGEKSCLNKLLNWLRNWKSWHITKSKEKKKGFGANDDGSCYKAVLLSGSPGIGKTTSAQLCCKELGLSSIELNASDARNKKTMEKHISESLACHSMTEYIKDNGDHRSQPNDIRHVLIMDEVDGMSGNEDRAGVAELITLIKKTRVPIICICNDRQSQKIRSLANYCYDLRFHKPMVAQIRGPMMSIAFKEGLKLTGQSMDEIIEGASHDIRQILQHLNLLAADCGEQMTAEKIKDAAKRAKKDTATNIFETARTLFSDNEATRSMSLIDKTELFFTDYSLVPLFVHENYLNCEPKDKKKTFEKLELYSKAADAIAVGDRIDKQIRTGGNWSLLNDQAMFSAVIPADTVRGYLHGMTQFPQWFGKNSKQGRFQRLLQQLQIHTSLKISSNFTSLNLDYIPVLRSALTKPLIHDDDGNGVEKVLQRLSAYDLTKDDMDNILELGQWPNTPLPMSLVAPKVKAALTRAYNKTVHCLPYAVDEAGKKSKTVKGTDSASAGTYGAILEVDEEGNEKEADYLDNNEDDSSSDEQSTAIMKIQTPQISKKDTKTKSKTSPSNKRGGKTGSSGGGRGRGGKKK